MLQEVHPKPIEHQQEIHQLLHHKWTSYKCPFADDDQQEGQTEYDGHVHGCDGSLEQGT